MSEDPRIGAVIDGRYQIERKLGSGVSGTVYAATQLAVDRTVAVKLLNDAVDANFARRFETEAKAIGKLNHPNIITLHDFGFCDEQDTHFMVTEFVEGELLADRMMDYMSVDHMMHVCLEIAMALNHAHGQGILHRDLKPENIMLAHSDKKWQTVKVLDFGLASMLDAADSPDRVGEILGSPAYMSPEQCRGEHDIDATTDIYSLGVMLFELLEGRPPFDGASRSEVFEKHLSEPAPEQQNAGTPDEVEALIARMLAKEPADRPQTAAEVVSVLEGEISLEKALRDESWEGMEWSLEAISEAEDPEAHAEDFTDLESDAPPPEGKKRGVFAVVAIAVVLVLGLILVVSSDEEPAQAATVETSPQPEPAAPAPAPEVDEPEVTVDDVAQKAGDELGHALAIGRTAAESLGNQLAEREREEQERREKRRKKKKKKKPKIRELKLSL